MPYPPPTPQTFAVEDAWKPLPLGHWRIDTAQHWLRRVGFAAPPEAVTAALRKSPDDCWEAAFLPGGATMPKPEELAEFEATVHERYREIHQSDADLETKREKYRELRQTDNDLFRQYAMDWFHYARQPENSAREKFVCFLQDVFVVERNTVRKCPALFNLQQTLRAHCTGDYRELCKKVSREPAMVRYLDLIQNTARKPNENFARELFELFTLGEGNYSEADIKEASRAFTGYRIKKRTDFFFQPSLHDGGEKTVFGETGRWDGDDIIDLTFQQPAAKTFLIRELIKFYLTDQPVPEPYIEALGEQWAQHEFSLRYLCQTFFQSRLFFHPAYRGNFVKSPIQFYLGLCQDLRLDVAPFESRVLRSMDVMGQSFYNPPDVRGWLYGEHWINSTTISGRRQLVDYLFAHLNEDKLNANDQQALKQAREAGRGQFLVTRERLRQVAETDAANLASHFATYFLTTPFHTTYTPILAEIINQGKNPTQSIRHAMIALLQSPAYNLC